VVCDVARPLSGSPGAIAERERDTTQKRYWIETAARQPVKAFCFRDSIKKANCFPSNLLASNLLASNKLAVTMATI